MNEVVGRVAFEEVFEDLFVQAYRVAHRILRNHNDAEDAAAETMARALDKWWRVGRMSTPAKWIVRVATNVALDTLRRRRRAKAKAPEAAPMSSSDAEGHVDIVDLLCRLPRRQCDVMTLRYLVGFSEAEIAAQLGISPGSVKRHASRAVDHLRRNETERVTSLVF